MVVVVRGAARAQYPHLFETMFEDRKRLFIDLLQWDMPVVAGRFEEDRFDRDDAVYLIALDADGGHAGSIRLLPSTRPHILADLFRPLCDGNVPLGASIFEITRLCLPVRHGAEGRLAIRNRLISAMVDHALDAGIRTLTGVVEAGFLAKVLAMGWRCSPLGEPKRCQGALLGAFRIEIDDSTPCRLTQTGIYGPNAIARRLPERAAA
jgi:acyl-homoserine lactone synthase